MSINKVFISGNLTRDPELRTAASGTSILGFGVAVNDRRKNQQTGEWEDYPNYVDCTMFGTRAEKLYQYIVKGTKVAIDGKLRWSQWAAQDGTKRSKLEVVVDELEIMTARGDAPRKTAPQPAQQQVYQQPQMFQPQGYMPPQSAPQAVQMPVQAPELMPMQVSVQPLYDEEIPF